LKTRPLELVLTPVDNQRLANLWGRWTRTCGKIETALDVTIARRGERFHGPRSASGPSGRGAAKILRRR